MNILVTGGAGYIGLHTCIELLKAGYNVVIYDNFYNSDISVIDRLQTITHKKISNVEADLNDEERIYAALVSYNCHAVIHFAGLKAVEESVKNPLIYYQNNVANTLCLLRAMKRAKIDKIIFSSSATVYGQPEFLPLTEHHRLKAINPYGRTKQFIEDILRDLYLAEPFWKIIILRYFNPVGAHESGLIGEDPKGHPNNLMPIIAQVSMGLRDKLYIYGNDYDTVDGTGLRDYIHVIDLALGHLQALRNLNQPRCDAINLGTGHGYTVLEVVKAFEKASGKTIAYEFAPRRPGDIGSCYADVSYAQKQLKWNATRHLNAMCLDAWRWQVNKIDHFS